MGLPAIVARAFPGNREEANRAGITPRIRIGTIDISTGRICAAGSPAQCHLAFDQVPEGVGIIVAYAVLRAASAIVPTHGIRDWTSMILVAIKHSSSKMLRT